MGQYFLTFALVILTSEDCAWHLLSPAYKPQAGVPFRPANLDIIETSHLMSQGAPTMLITLRREGQRL